MARVDNFSHSKSAHCGKLSQRKKERQDCTYAKMILDGRGESKREKKWEKEALVAIKCNYLPSGQVFVDDVFCFQVFHAGSYLGRHEDETVDAAKYQKNSELINTTALSLLIIFYFMRYD